MIRVFQDRAAQAVISPDRSRAKAPSLDIDVWLWSLDQDPRQAERSMAGLTPVERDRAARFVTHQLRMRWACARATLRRILAWYLDVEPSTLAFDANTYGKPFLTPASQPPLHFNLSHSLGMAGVAVSRDGPLGFDIEGGREAPLEVANDVFSDAELEALARHAPAERPHAFYRAWTRKEAFIKAIGSGLSHPLKSFDVTLDQAAPRFTRIDGDRPSDWVMAGVEPGEGDWFAAVAMQTGGRALDIHIHDAAVVWAEARDGEN